jgi:hypothetical protein
MIKAQILESFIEKLSETYRFPSIKAESFRRSWTKLISKLPQSL